MSLLSLPQELRDIRHSSLSSDTAKPTDFPMMLATVIVNDQPYRINPMLSKIYMKPKSGKGMNQSYSPLLRKASFIPGKKTVVPVFNFDFCEMISFVKTLKPQEINAANHNHNLVVNLFLFDAKALEAQRLLQWVELCDAVGLQNVGYVLQWTAHNVNYLKEIDAVVGGYREGKKIVEALSAKNVTNWNWARHRSNLKQRT